MKQIDLNQSVHDLCQAYPELIDVLVELGFKDITKPGMLNTAGRIMTIKKGAQMKRIDMSEIHAKLAAAGFEVIEA